MPEPALFTLREALTQFADATQTQDQEHIKPLHWHIASRLVIDGGFRPTDITPTPPLRVESSGAGRHRKHLLHFDASAARPGEQTLLGGLKTKDVDVVVSIQGVGPCLAISVKGMMNAFRNLTNRMEEAAGDCTNLHIAYPALVYGFFIVIRANRISEGAKPNDIAIYDDGSINDGISRFHDAMGKLTGRRDLRNDVSRYESIAMLLVETIPEFRGAIVGSFPPVDSQLHFDVFFPRLYRMYDLRFVYAAQALRRFTQRLEWSSESPALHEPEVTTFAPRLMGSE
ncbi:MAG: hypothetical protein ACT4QC_22970 [Planctomycetaceae bacterium]